MPGNDPSQENLRRRGLELQAALPEPTGWAARWARRRPSEGAEIAGGAIDGLALGGLWGVLLVVPAAIIWAVRRLRRRPGP